MQFRRTWLIATALSLASWGGLWSSAVQAQQYPSKPVRIISPFPVGGGPDGVARLLADKLSREWGQSVVVENRPGGNGFIAIDAFKRGDKNGYDILVVDNVHLAAYPSLFKQLPYDPVKDFDILLPLFKTYFFFTVGKDSPYQSVGQIIADAKRRPGKLDFGSWSIGNPAHLGGELLESMAGIQMEHVIYKETSQLYTSVANNELAFALGTAATAGPLYRAGKLRLLAVTASHRVATYPDVPTIVESGGPAGFEMTGWNVLAVPPGVPREVTDKIRSSVARALAADDIQEKFKSFGYEPFVATAAEFNQFLAEETQRYSAVIKQANVSID